MDWPQAVLVVVLVVVAVAVWTMSSPSPARRKEGFESGLDEVYHAKKYGDIGICFSFL